MKAAAEFIREHDELETGSSVWADVEDSFARHALADYIDAIMRHNLEIAEKEKTV